MSPYKILFLLPYPIDEAPSQRFRVEQYFNILASQGSQFTVHTFFNTSDWKLIYAKGNLGRKLILFLLGFIKRVGTLFIAWQYDLIFIHREATPMGPPLFEWILAKVLQRKIIYDFDDAIWQTDRVDESWLERIMRWRVKVKQICKWSYKVSCGNEYLVKYALQYNNSVVLNPTTINTHQQHNPALYSTMKNDKRITIGWTGSRSTLKYLKILESVLRSLQQTYDHVDFLIIADQRPAFALDRITFVPWSKSTEVSALMFVDIGVMPLPNDAWANGKCGFKALQYMALEIPCVASPVGVNTEIIQHNENGFLCDNDEAWIVVLEKLIEDATLRSRIGVAGRKTVIDRYSVDSNSSNFLSLFQ